MARVDLQPVTLRPSDNAVDVVFDAATGPRADIGPIEINGLEAMHEDFVRRRLLLHQGEQFSPSAIDAARQDLMSLGVFSQVRMEPAGQLDAQGNLPITIAVTERKLHSVDVGVAYSTDLGINLNAGWHDRNLFGNAEQLNLTGAVDLGGTAVNGLGYRFNAQFIKPDFLARDQQLELDLTALKQNLKAYDQTGFIEQAILNRKFSPHWSGSVGLLGEQEEVTQEGATNHYNLLGVPIVARYDSTNSQFDPTEGIRGSVGLTPTEFIRRPQRHLLCHASFRLDLYRCQRRWPERRGAPRTYRQDRRGGRVQSASRPAVLCRRQRHRARLSLSVDRAAIP